MPFDGKQFSKQLPQKPGIYQMFNDLGKVIYVGKALNLKNRVSSYYTGKARDSKTMALVESIADIRFSITRTEGEALIPVNLDRHLIRI
ncbi:MAG TPA: nucleotide excision repair endonuclease [Gammaproteobacteria bacterium]|nr:nucleotide excision repair endonuclease [Xanthomonadales bacterium]MCB1595342.1 nucleotide excision repair endonuclease [Xanthomonadales bacterium]HOP23028.1 nucleotide excision repair endonuclease [Gammaproteobacteria bacterium]HPI96720.1 nucleotide excision repair endonuclease [Gammaproteobacteria bacterium]HPQ88136.1 nucleotide excision repair endonuclease [Gammaproteobacteria bacterium]